MFMVQFFRRLFIQNNESIQFTDIRPRKHLDILRLLKVSLTVSTRILMTGHVN